MNISVEDGVSVFLFNYIKLIVRISDENDVILIFSQFFYQVYLLEGLQLGIEVISLIVVDFDFGFNGLVIYSFYLEVQEMYLDIFNVNIQSGRVIILKQLDREILSQYVLKVIVRDQFVLFLLSIVIIYFIVDDENDNVSVFYF